MSVTTSRILEAKSDPRGQGVDLWSQLTQGVWPRSVVMGGWGHGTGGRWRASRPHCARKKHR